MTLGWHKSVEKRDCAVDFSARKEYSSRGIRRDTRKTASRAGRKQLAVETRKYAKLTLAIARVMGAELRTC